MGVLRVLRVLRVLGSFKEFQGVLRVFLGILGVLRVFREFAIISPVFRQKTVTNNHQLGDSPTSGRHTAGHCPMGHLALVLYNQKIHTATHG